MPTDLDALLSPGRIGALELANRILMAPMGEDLGENDGTVSQAQIDYLDARARGGAALVTLGSVAVAHPEGCALARQVGLSEDRMIPGFAALAERVHAAGSKLGVQLSHMGKVALMDVAAGRPPLVPSPPSPIEFDRLYGMLTPDEMAAMAAPMTTPGATFEHRIMDQADIEAVVEQFAAAAGRAQEAGIDAVEIHAGHGYLIDSFLSPRSNGRTDDYGGPIENRARLLLEVIGAIRDRVGRDYPLWCRINAIEKFVDGTRIEDAIATARLAEAAGVDAVHVSAYADAGRAIGTTESHTTHHPNGLVELARAVKAELSVPVVAVGRIEPEVGDRLIRDGAIDFVAMGRKLLADPELPKKLGAGRGAEVRPCIYHYRCIGNIFVREPVACVANPQVGREGPLAVSAASAGRRVLVVGGGPAGMETARVAALRGHDVLLAEAGAELGGAFRLAAGCSAPNRELLEWLLAQVEHPNIEIRLDTTVDLAGAQDMAADCVVVATGARWRGAEVLAPWLCDGRDLPGHRVVVLGGSVAGLGIAEAACRDGHLVTIVEEAEVFGSQLGLPGRWHLVDSLEREGVELLGGAEVTAVEGDGVRWRRGETTGVVSADVVVDAVPAPGSSILAGELRDAGVEVHTVGDADGVGWIEGAMRSGLEVARAL